MKYIVMRKPVLMEDEGRHFHIKMYNTRAEAAAWINEQKGEYHPPSDYYIAECKE